jgi:hypothetical protein
MAAPRKTLLEWIDLEDGDTPGSIQPACSAKIQALHAQILVAAGNAPAEPIQPPAGLRLAPLG